MYPNESDEYFEDFDYYFDAPDSQEEEEIDDYINSRGGIDKCMCCGKYKYNDQLKYPDQTCASGCVNPNEY